MRCTQQFAVCLRMSFPSHQLAGASMAGRGKKALVDAARGGQTDRAVHHLATRPTWAPCERSAPQIDRPPLLIKTSLFTCGFATVIVLHVNVKLHVWA